MCNEQEEPCSMNAIAILKKHIVTTAKEVFGISDDALKNFELKINTESQNSFGDISCNIAMILAKAVGQNPRAVATTIMQRLEAMALPSIQSLAIAGPGFLNITLSTAAWQSLVADLYSAKSSFFKPYNLKKNKYLIEFVSANPTGPLHLGGGRGGIIGDTLARVLSFLGHTVHKEYYINDAGNQVKLLAQSFKARCLQALGMDAVVPEDGYGGQYLVDTAKECVSQHGNAVVHKDDQFFLDYAKDHMIAGVKQDLARYNVIFDQWFSEKSLHDDGSIDRVLTLLQEKDLVYEQEGALWFRSTMFGDDKDRVIRKSTGELTYIAADIAYHKSKFDRGFDVLIDILGHDHHGYVNRLKATMQALGYSADQLQVILYQLVSIKNAGAVVRMSKRAGTFTELSDVMDAVGVDVARYFYLKSRTESALDFDMEVAVKQTDENPVYYIQYAYVRMNSVLNKAKAEGFEASGDCSALVTHFGADDRMLVKKIVSLSDTLQAIASSHSTHLMALYAHELATTFHAYYTRNKIIDASQPEVTQLRLCLVGLTHQTLDICLDLLGLTKPERM